VTWGIFSSSGDFKLSPDDLLLQWNWNSKSFWKQSFELLGRNIAPLHLRSERWAESALRASWFWPTSDRYPRTWGIFSSPGDPKLTPDHLGLKWTWKGKTFWTLTFELLGRNIAPLHFKTERLGKTVLRPWWFWQTSAKFPGIWGIFSTPGSLY